MSFTSDETDCDGSIIGLHTEANILWKIPGYFSQQKADFFYESPVFHFLGSSWRLSIYPNGQRVNKSVGFVELYVLRKQLVGEYDISFKMSILGGDAPLCEKQDYCYKHMSSSGFVSFMERRVLLNNRFLVAPQGTLKIKFVGERIQTTSQTKIVDGVDGLCQDFQNLLSGGQGTDVNIRVKTQVFPVHRVILGARSTVFAAMFEHDMREKITGSVNIEDCDPAVFQKFLSFVYSGKIDDLNSENVTDVFSLANKYDVSDLRQICIDFMKENLCLSMVFDVLVIADKCNLEGLKKSATELILDNITYIMSTKSWIPFVRENPQLTTEIVNKICLMKTSDQACQLSVAPLNYEKASSSGSCYITSSSGSYQPRSQNDCSGRAPYRRYPQRRDINNYELELSAYDMLI